MRAFATSYLVHSGEAIKDENDRPLDFSCTPWLADAAETSAAAKYLKAAHIRMRPGQVLLECALSRDGTVVDRPVLIVGDGDWGTIEMNEHGGPRQFKVEVRPSTSAADIEAANKASAAAKVR